MKIKKCKVCEKKIEVKRDRIGSNRWIGNNSKSGFEELNSDEGVAFGSNSTVWFCNKCWEEITKYVMDR